MTPPVAQVRTSDAFDRDDENPFSTTNGWESINCRLVNNVITVIDPGPAAATVTDADYVPAHNGQQVWVVASAIREPSYFGVGARIVTGDRWGGYLLSLQYATGGVRGLLLEKYDSNHAGIRRVLGTVFIDTVKQANTDFGVTQKLRLIVTDTDEGVMLHCYLNNDDDAAPNLAFHDLGQYSSGPATFQPEGSGGVATVPQVVQIPVSLLNDTTFSRSDMMCVGVRFHQGEVTSTNIPFRVTGARDRSDEVQWRAYGRRYPDDSIKYAEMRFPAVWGQGDDPEKPCTIVQQQEPNPFPFTWTQTTVSKLTAKEPQTAWIFRLHENGQQPVFLAFTIDDFSLLGSASEPHVLRFRSFKRFGTPGTRTRNIWVNMVLELYSGMNHGQMYVEFGNSMCARPTDVLDWVAPNNRRDPLDLDPLGEPFMELETTVSSPLEHSFTMTVIGPDMYMRGEEHKVYYSQRQDWGNGARRSDFILINGNQNPINGDTEKFTFGSSHGYKFGICFDQRGVDPTHDAEHADDTYAIARDWVEKGGVPAFYNVPPYPDYIDGDDRDNVLQRIQHYCSRWENAAALNDPFFNAQFITANKTGTTGEQGQGLYTAIRGWIAMRAGYPLILRIIERETRQEKIRPNLFMGPNGEAFDPLFFNLNGHPVYTWNSTLYDDNVGSNILGINTGLAPEVIEDSHSPFKWYGPDRQHYTLVIQTLGAFLGRDYMQVAQMENMAQMWIAENRTNGPGFIPLIDEDGSRGYGHVLMAGAQLAELTGIQAITDQMIHRVRLLEEEVDNHPDQRYFGNAALLTAPNNIIALMDSAPNPGNSSALYTERFVSWDTSIGVMGLWAAYLHLGDQHPYGAIARRIAGEVAGTITQHFYQDFRTDHQILYFDTLSEEWRGNAGQSTYEGETCTGGTSGATGEVYAIMHEGNKRRIFLKDCVGLFRDAETITFTGSSATGVVKSVQHRYFTITALASNLGVELTVADKEATILHALSTFTVNNAPPTTSPTVITVATDPTNNIEVGDVVTVTGVLGNIAVNGDWTVTAVDATSISVDVDTSASGGYISGGTVTEYEWLLEMVRYSPDGSYEPRHLVGPVIAATLAKPEVHFYDGPPNRNSTILTLAGDIYEDMKEWFDHENVDEWNDKFDEIFAVVPDVPDIVEVDPPAAPVNFNLTTLSTSELLVEFDPDTLAQYTEVELSLDGVTGWLTKLTIRHDQDYPGPSSSGIIGSLDDNTLYFGRARSFNLSGGQQSPYSTGDSATTLEDTGGGGGQQPIEFVPPQRAVGTWGFFLSGTGAFIDFFEAVDKIVLRAKNVEAGRTLKELREATLRLVDRTTSSNRDPETVNQFVREAVDQLLIELGDHGLFARVEENLDLVADSTGRIFMPRNCERVEAVRRVVDGCKYEFTYRDQSVDGIVSIQLKDRPYSFAETLRVTYFRLPGELCEDDDRTFIPQRIDEAVTVGAALRCAEQDSDPRLQDTLLRRLMACIDRARKHMARIYRQSNERVETLGRYAPRMRIIR